MTESVWDTVQKALIDAEIDTYPPGQKVGDCTAAYCVLKDAGATNIPGYSSEEHYYDLMCYVPRDKYFSLAGFVAQCKEVMAQAPIYPMLMPTGIETPSFFDDTFNAYMISVRYRNNVRNPHIKQI